MENLKKIGGVGVVIGVIASLYLGLTDGGSKIVERVVEQRTETVGALSGPDLVLPYLSVNGVERFYSSAKFNQGTSTACVLISPNATSTLVFGSVQVTEATATDIYIDMGKGGIESNATTTALASNFQWSNTGTLNDDINPTFYASSTAAANDVNLIFTPLQEFVVRLSAKNVERVGTAKSTFDLDGTCNAVWELAGQ